MSEISLLGIEKMTPVAARMVYFDKIMDKAWELYHKYDMSVCVLNFPQFESKWILGEDVVNILRLSIELSDSYCNDLTLFNIPVEIDKHNRNIMRLIMEVK